MNERVEKRRHGFVDDERIRNAYPGYAKLRERWVLLCDFAGSRTAGSGLYQLRIGYIYRSTQLRTGRIQREMERASICESQAFDLQCKFQEPGIVCEIVGTRSCALRHPHAKPSKLYLSVPSGTFGYTTANIQ